MVPGGTRAANPVHHKMDSTAHSQNFYKSVYLPVIGKQLVLEKELTRQSTQ